MVTFQLRKLATFTFFLDFKRSELCSLTVATTPLLLATLSLRPACALRLLPLGGPLVKGQALHPGLLTKQRLPAGATLLHLAASLGAAAEPIAFEDFQRVQLCSGRILEVQDHLNAERLFVLKVDIGEEAPRQIVAGIKSRYSADELVGRTCVVVANLKPAKLRGVESQGMLLAAGAKEVVDLVSVGAEPGTIVR